MSLHSLEIEHRMPCVHTRVMDMSPRFYLRFLVAAIAPLGVVYVSPCQKGSVFRAFLDMLTSLSNMAVQLDNCTEISRVSVHGICSHQQESSVTPR